MTKEERAIDQETILREAATLEAAGSEWKMRHVAAVLNCAVSTVYNTPWLLAIARRVGKRGLRWVPAEVRNHGPLARAKRTGS